ncbi:MAG: hypothetical protein C4583_16060 [Anaerolineaceae bacterium]|nr:MAG: hypothetical protein C4583_16060 [Anaerolineaceae bacterium]
MQKKTGNVLLFLVVCINLVACGPTQADLNAQATESAVSIAQTQTFQAPTLTPQPSKTPKPTLTPTLTRLPTHTLVPTPSMLAYTNAQWNYSIQYPSNWLLLEEQAYTVFQSANEANTWVLITVYNTVRSERALIDDTLASQREKGNLKEIISEGTKTFNGLTWRFVIFSTNSSTFEDWYARIGADGKAYMFFGTSNGRNHDRLTQVYLEMIESFR